MKKFTGNIKRTFMLIICIIMVSAALPVRIIAAPNEVAFVPASTEMRGVWVTTAYNLDWPSRNNLTPAQMRTEVDTMLGNLKAQGINAIFLQVTPFADAIWNSEILPWSRFLTGTQGQAPAEGFDPLAYWIERGHALGMEVHAWINPYRVTFRRAADNSPFDQLAPNHPARLNRSLVIEYNGRLYFDPGNPAARQIILDYVTELLTNYALDGIHLDDYFYPSRNFPDAATHARFGSGMDLHDWRRENVNTLVRDLQRITHETRDGARFGISPIGIWQNWGPTQPHGSRMVLNGEVRGTRGNESYHALYADTRRWVLEGWVDYIVPQIYWFEGHTHACYEGVVTWWEDLVRGTDVSLYIGLAAYREEAASPASRWHDPRFNLSDWDGEIVRQLQRNASSDVIQGNIFFRAQRLESRVGEAIANFYRTQPVTIPPTMVPGGSYDGNFTTGPAMPQRPPGTGYLGTTQTFAPPPPALSINITSLSVAQPIGNRYVVNGASGFNFFGAAVPGVPVYVNGTEITNRTPEGFFQIFLPLRAGENNFTFTQAGSSNVNRTVINGPDPNVEIVHPPTMATPQITDVFPQVDEWHRPGTTITLRATAPAGSTVTAQIGGQTVVLTQVNPRHESTATRITATAFTGTFTLNHSAADDTIIDIGRPVYTMTFRDTTRTATAPAMIRQIGVVAPLFAEVTAASAWVFSQPATTGGSGWMLMRGQRDRVAGVSANWTQLASGGWVSTNAIRTFRDENLTMPGVGFISEGRYVRGDVQDVITWQVPFFPAMYAEFDGSQLIVSFGMQPMAPPLIYNIDQTMFSNIRIGQHNGRPAYFMTLRQGAFLEGVYFEHEGDEMRLILRRRRPLTPGNYPLRGFTFVIDPGHGGTDPGAIGATGAHLSESHIVLTQSLLLEQRLTDLGATVVMSRRTDVFPSLHDRVQLNLRTMPDMFLSLHTNSTVRTADATNIRGFSVWYRTANSHNAAASFMNSMYNINPNTNRARHAQQANLYVSRPMWAPSLILEASFMNNIQDFAWMINPRHQSEYVWAIVNAVLTYFGEAN